METRSFDVIIMTSKVGSGFRRFVLAGGMLRDELCPGLLRGGSQAIGSHSTVCQSLIRERWLLHLFIKLSKGVGGCYTWRNNLSTKACCVQKIVSVCACSENWDFRWVVTEKGFHRRFPEISMEKGCLCRYWYPHHWRHSRQGWTVNLVENLETL